MKQVELQEKTAKEFGFYWDHLDQLTDQIKSECAEIKEAWEKGDLKHLQEEVGDLLQAAISVAVFCNLDPEETLQQSILKFQKRYDKLVGLAKEDGLDNLKGKDFAAQLSYWERAKRV